MTYEQLRQRILDLDGRPLTLNDQEVDALSAETIARIQEEFAASILLELPPRERAFMDWLRSEDAQVYNDLWSDDEDLLVSLLHLPALQRAGEGFPICELESAPNYYFTKRHILKDGVDAMPAILDRAERGEQLSVGEGLMFEVLKRPLDLWHFCYRYGVPVDMGKRVVADLVARGWLVHLVQREDLAKYLDD